MAEGRITTILIGVLLFIMGSVAFGNFIWGVFGEYGRSPNIIDAESFTSHGGAIRNQSEVMQEKLVDVQTDPGIWDIASFVITGGYSAAKIALGSIGILWGMLAQFFSSETGFGFFGIGYVFTWLMVIITVVVIMAVLGAILKREL